MNRKLNLRIGILVIIGLLTIATGAGCKPTATPPTVPAEKPMEPLVIPVLIDLTGPIAAAHFSGSIMAAAHTKATNDMGGILGRQVKLVPYDTKFDVGFASTVFEKALADTNAPVMLVVGSTITEACMPLADKHKVPQLNTSNTPKIDANRGYTFAFNVQYGDEYLAICKWIMEKHWKQQRPPKIGILLADTSFGRALLPALPVSEKEFGVKNLEPQYIPLTPTDITAQLTMLKSQNPDYIWLTHVDLPGAKAVNGCFELGLTPKATLIMGSNTTSFTQLKRAGATDQALEGMLQISAWLADFLPDVPKAKRLDDWVKANYPKDWPVGGVAVVFENTMQLATKGTEMAVKKVGWDGLNGQAVFDTYISGQTIDAEGLAGNMKFGPERRCAVTELSMFKYTQGKVTRLTDWFPCKLYSLK